MRGVFTGIVEEAGRVGSLKATPDGMRLVLRSRVCAKGLKPGDSLAVNGCCLTVVKLSRTPKETRLQFDLLRETWRRTNLQDLQSGSLVNLERPLKAGGRLHGHFVTGHVDGMGRITRLDRVGPDTLLEVRCPADILRHVVFKGSIALDGISLTVASLTRSGFGVWVIPHTMSVTALKERRVGDRVNLEADLLAKHVARLLGRMNIPRLDKRTTVVQ